MTGWHYAGYREYPQRWEIGKTGGSFDDLNYNSSNNTKSGWYGGVQYDGDVFRAKSILQNLTQYMGYDDDNNDDEFSSATLNYEIEYEIAGFFFWQGDRDTYNNDPVYAKRYSINLERFVTSLRRDFNAPHAKFVLATLGQIPASIIANNETGNGDDVVEQRSRDLRRKNKKKQEQQQEDTKTALRIEMQERLVFEAQMKLPQRPGFIGNTACVYTYPYCRSESMKSSTNHYKHSLEIFMEVGFAMGRAMVDLLTRSDDIVSELRRPI